MNRADAVMRRYLEWQHTAFVASHIGGSTVLAIAFLPALALPLLPSSEFAVPLFGTFWLMAASGATGVYLLDVSRRSRSATGSAILLHAARGVAVVLGLAGAAAGVVVLIRVVWLSGAGAPSWTTVAGAVFVAGTVIFGGLSLAYRACGGGGR